MKDQSTAEDVVTENQLKKLTYVLHILLNAHKRDKEKLADISKRMIVIETKLDFLPRMIALGLSLVVIVVSCMNWIIAHYGK